MKITQYPSNNFSERKILFPQELEAIVIHWTAGFFNGAVAWMCDKQSQASAHYCISQDGSKVYQLVSDDKKAWHAGYSFLNGKPYVNEFSIGIELEGPPSITRTPWDDRQITVCAELCRELINKYSGIKTITDHSTISDLWNDYANKNGLIPRQYKKDVLLGVGEDEFPWAKFISMVSV